VNEPLPQFVHPVVDRLLSIEGIVTFSAKRNCEATAILDEIERELSQWYGDRRLEM
jgi:hypothetical protein